MNRIKYVVRIVLVVITILLLIDLTLKTDDSAQTITEFKINTFEKIQKDSLDTRHKADLLIDETRSFMDSSIHVRKRVHHLMTVLGLFVAIEIFFLVSKKI